MKKFKQRNLISMLTNFGFAAFFGFSVAHATKLPLLGLVVGLLMSTVYFLPMPHGILGTNAVWEKDDGKGGIEFKKLSDDELEEVRKKDPSGETLAKYYTAHNKHMLAEIEAKVDAKADTSAVEELRTKYYELLQKRTDELYAIVEKQGRYMKENERKQNQEEVKTFKSAFTKAWKSNKDKIGALLSKDSRAVSFEIEAEMSGKTVSVVGSMTGNIPPQQTLPGVNHLAVRRPILSEIITEQTATSDKIDYVEENTTVDNSAFIAENTAIPDSDQTWIQRQETMKKVADSIKMTIEAMEDVEFVTGEVNTKLRERVILQEDDALLNGTGAGVEILGLNNVAQAYAAGPFALSIPNPTIYDVLVTAKNQVEVSGQNNKFLVTVAMLHPTDITFMQLSKDANDQYLVPPFVSDDGTMVMGMIIIPNNNITQDDFLIGDFSKTRKYVKRALTVLMSTENQDDFQNDRVTIKATKRVMLLTENLDQDGFVNGTLSTAITALTQP